MPDLPPEIGPVVLAVLEARPREADAAAPADDFSIRPLDVPPCTGCTSSLCPDCRPGTHPGRR